MTQAICIFCGYRKFGAFSVCDNCDLGPTDEEQLAKSVLLTDHFYSLEELDDIGEHLSLGGTCEYAEHLVEGFVQTFRKSGRKSGVENLGKSSQFDENRNQETQVLDLVGDKESDQQNEKCGIQERILFSRLYAYVQERLVIAIGTDPEQWLDAEVEIWQTLENAEVEVDNFGSGRIVGIEERKKYLDPLFVIKCDDGQDLVFNIDSFISDNPNSLISVPVWFVDEMFKHFETEALKAGKDIGASLNKANNSNIKLSISSYINPMRSVDYSFTFKICICGKWKVSTVPTSEPFGVKDFAKRMANFSPMSGEIVLDLSYIPDNVMIFDLKISPHHSGEKAIVDIYTQDVYDEGGVVSEESLREFVPIRKVNEVGRAILATIRDDELFEYEFDDCC